MAGSRVVDLSSRAVNSFERMDIQINPKILASGAVTAADATRLALSRADGPAATHVFVRRFDRQSHATASAIDLARSAGVPMPPLAGMPVTVKDLFDVAGHPTTGASRAMDDAAPAAADCPVVARLRQAGAVLLGHSNLSEFAFSGVGINPHHGTPVNPASPPGEALIPGGSTSGGAVSVALGVAFAALGSDTGGSIRIPAALQGLVGFKNTQRLTPLDGSIPLSTTLDTACAITRSVGDAVLLHGVLSGRAPRLSPKPLAAFRFAMPRTLMLDGLEPAVAGAIDRAIDAIARAGAHVVDIDLPPLAELSSLMAQGGFAAPESWAWHRRRLGEREALYDPRVALRIRRGAAMSAADYLDLHRARADWIARIERAVEGFDALLSPTLPMVAPAIAPLLASDERFFATNGLLLRNPSAVNMLDGCALSLPCPIDGGLPVGLMVWGPAMSDDAVLSASLAIETALAGVS